MDLTSLKVIKNLLKQHRIFPSKRFGQNFLINKSVLFKIIKAANLQPNDVVLEIGPGIGNLTQEIAKRVKKVIAVEKDRRMVEILKETLKEFNSVKIICGDILKIEKWKLFENCKLPARFAQLRKAGGKIENFKVVANLPYYIVSPVIRKFLENAQVRPVQMILMVQKEVAQRIVAKPPDMNLLAVSVQFYAQPKIISFVSKKSFWPQPKVDGAIIKITPKSDRNYAIARNLSTLFFKIVRAGFSQPRKQLVNNLSKGLALSLPNGLKLDKPRSRASSLRGRKKVKSWLLKNGINPSQRAETLSLEDWISLVKDFPFLL